jgi:hypothetical protein
MIDDRVIEVMKQHRQKMEWLAAEQRTISRRNTEVS